MKKTDLYWLSLKINTMLILILIIYDIQILIISWKYIFIGDHRILLIFDFSRRVQLWLSILDWLNDESLKI